MSRQAITPAMKIDSLFFWNDIECAECGTYIFAGEPIEWDHRHALVHGGKHDHTNIRPLHERCHTKKTARDVAANAKVKRLKGETCQGLKKKIQSRPFDKTKTKKLSGQVVPRHQGMGER